MNPNARRKDILLADSIEHWVSIYYTPHAGGERKQERVESTGVDSRLLTILKDFNLRSCIAVAFSPDNPNESPLVREYTIPSLLRSIHQANDRLIEVRFTIIPGSTINPSKDTARDKDGKLYQCIDMKSILIDYVLSSGTFGASSNAKVFLPSGLIRLS
jgi:hypothetical protein